MSWSLYNKVEKLRVDGLTLEQVRTILLAIPTAKMKDWYALQEGELRWESILSIHELYEDVRELKGVAIPAPMPDRSGETSAPSGRQNLHRPMFEDAEDDATGSVIMIAADTKERRTARRYSRKLQFRVVHGEQEFECQTLDISMNGLSLDQELPAWVPKFFKAELEYNGARIEILCTKVDVNSLKLVESDSWDLIRKWLVG